LDANKVKRAFVELMTDSWSCTRIFFCTCINYLLGVLIKWVIKISTYQAEGHYLLSHKTFITRSSLGTIIFQNHKLFGGKILRISYVNKLLFW